MRKRIMLHGEIAGNIWMPAVECTKEFRLELIRITRKQHHSDGSRHRTSLDGSHLLARCLAPHNE